MMSSDPGETSALSGGSPTHSKRRQQRQRRQQHQHQQRCRPTCGCLMITVAFTLLGTAALSASIFTDYWERIDYNASSIDAIARRNNATHRLTWLFNKTVARIALGPSSSVVSPSYSSSGSKLVRSSSTKRNLTTANGVPDRLFAASTYVQLAPAAIESAQQQQIRWTDETLNKSRTLVRRRKHVQHGRKKRSRRPVSPFYLIPLHGGIWHLCVDLQNDQLRMLQEMGLDRDACTEYLAGTGSSSGSTAENDDIRLTPNYLHHHVQSKMHNLSISCAMVCVILLASAALLGTFGIIQRQISAVLITGVMYILAALFAVFSLVIMHCKRNTRRETGIVDDPLVNATEYNEARIFTNSWSMLLGWVGSAVIFVASLFWLFLAKVMRYNQLTFF